MCSYTCQWAHENDSHLAPTTHVWCHRSWRIYCHFAIQSRGWQQLNPSIICGSLYVYYSQLRFSSPVFSKLLTWSSTDRCGFRFLSFPSSCHAEEFNSQRRGLQVQRGCSHSQTSLAAVAWLVWVCPSPGYFLPASISSALPEDPEAIFEHFLCLSKFPRHEIWNRWSCKILPTAEHGKYYI